jgi:hypothetical protein
MADSSHDVGADDATLMGINVRWHDDFILSAASRNFKIQNTPRPTI